MRKVLFIVGAVIFTIVNMKLCKVIDNIEKETILYLFLEILELFSCSIGFIIGKKKED